MDAIGNPGSLSFVTLIGVLVILVVAFLLHLRSRKNREAAKKVHGLKD